MSSGSIIQNLYQKKPLMSVLFLTRRTKKTNKVYSGVIQCGQKDKENNSFAPYV